MTRLWLVVAGTLALAGCGESTTGVRLTLELEAGVTIDQLQVQFELAGVPLVSKLVPATAGAPLQSRRDLVVLFTPEAGGQEARFIVAGLLGGTPAARGEASVRVRARSTVTVTVLLAPASCPAQTHSCGGSCFADDDAEHCGLSCRVCVVPAQGRAACEEGLCQWHCLAGYAPCGEEECTDPLIDPRNCGGCGQQCDSGQVCLQGKCGANPCPSGQHQCSAGCVPDTDVATCGWRCDPCPVPVGGSATCDGAACAAVCPTGLRVCLAECVDALTDRRHCGDCQQTCGSDETCTGGDCLPSGCAAGTHSCAGECVSDNDVAHCGASCDPCTVPTGGQATCDGVSCGSKCPWNKRLCGAACVDYYDPQHCGPSCLACPGAPHAEAACDGSGCYLACETGYHPCGEACVSNTDVAHCGTSCAACPAPPANAVATCDGTACGWACVGGYHECDGTCVTNDDIAHCGWACSTCPSIGGAYAVCTASGCNVTCTTGFHNCGGWCQADGQTCPCPTCPAGQYCFAETGKCYTPGRCSANDECPKGGYSTGECSFGACHCMYHPCRNYEKCEWVDLGGGWDEMLCIPL